MAVPDVVPEILCRESYLTATMFIKKDCGYIWHQTGRKEVATWKIKIPREVGNVKTVGAILEKDIHIDKGEASTAPSPDAS